MPIEVFPGKTGERLIARMPVSPGSYAHIHTVQGFCMRATYQGCSSSGYPVLSPELDSLPSGTRGSIEAERLQLLRDQQHYLDPELYPDPTYTRTRRAAQEMIDEIRAAVPHFSSIKIGTPLLLVVPNLFPTTRYQLGVVSSWEIFNT